MKLSSLTQQDKIKLAAELDGWHRDGCEYDEERWKRGTETHIGNPMRNAATSYDAIIPLIQKQDADTDYRLLKELNKMCWWDYSPTQLLDALLVATGKVEL
jgi:hypothetical protein